MTRNKIIWKIVLIHLLFYLVIMLLHSCGLFKNTSKQQSSSAFEISKQTELQQLDLTKVYRESKIYSYRPDGTVAEFEHRREQLDAASLKKIKATENVSKKSSQMQKQSSPAKLRIAGVLAIVLVCCILIYNRYFK